MEIKNDRLLVRWQDGTYDRVRSCDECHSPSCSYPVHNDRYREIGTVKEPAPSYWDWMAMNDPLGHHTNGLGEKFFKEYYSANPDGLQEEETRTSGISKEQYEIMQEAFDQLTPKQQEVWTLVMREQLSQTEAARRLGITQQGVDKHLRYAKLKFTDYLRSQQNRAAAE